MQKKFIFISTIWIASLFVLIVCLFLFHNNSNSLEILVEKNKNCIGKKYYFNSMNRDIYIDCLDSISIKKNGIKYDLKDAIQKGIISFEQLLKESKSKLEYWDGGSVLYKYENFSIIVYQRQLEDNKWCNYIVIGNENINVDDYCD